MQSPTRRLVVRVSALCAAAVVAACAERSPVAPGARANGPDGATAVAGGPQRVSLIVPPAEICKKGSAATLAVSINGSSPENWDLNDGDCFVVAYGSDGLQTVTVTEVAATPGYSLDSIIRDTSVWDDNGNATHALARITGQTSATITINTNLGGTLTFYNSAPPPPNACVNGPLGGVDLGVLPGYLFFFADGSSDANWQGATKGFAGDVVVNGLVARERTSGGVPFAGVLSTNDVTLGAWQAIVNQNSGHATAAYGQTALVSTLRASLVNAMNQINALPVTPGFENRSAASLNGLNTMDGIARTTVINVTSGFQVSSQINITGDAGDVFVLRWDTDANFGNGYQGQVKFQSGGAIVPRGGLTAGNFIHVAGDINASGGGSNPPAPYPQGPRLNNGTGALVPGASNFSGGGFFTGYWLTTGSPKNGETASLSNAVFVGGWYSLTTKFSMTSGTSGVHVCPNASGSPPL